MSSDFRNIGIPLYCEHCGSSMFDKEWGLVHSEGCHFNVKYEPELKPEQKEINPLKTNGISNEMADDLSRFYGTDGPFKAACGDFNKGKQTMTTDKTKLFELVYRDVMTEGGQGFDHIVVESQDHKILSDQFELFLKTKPYGNWKKKNLDNGDIVFWDQQERFVFSYHDRTQICLVVHMDRKQ